MKWKLFAVACMCLGEAFAQSPSGPPALGPVILSSKASSIVPCGDKVVMAGDFDWAGPLSGSAVVVDRTTITPQEGWPMFHGDIVTVVADGSGGWYVGGSFTVAGNSNAANLVHILADKSIDPSWYPRPNGFIDQIIKVGTKLFVGGLFDNIAGQTRLNLASFDNQVLTSWSPNPDYWVHTIAMTSGNVLFVGGRFNNIGGQARNSLAAVDPDTGVVSSWNAALQPANAVVYSLVASGSTIYIGGVFTRAGAPFRNNIAAMDVSTAVTSSWNPNANAIVYNMVLDGGTMYVGGLFATIGGQTRNRLADISLATGLAGSLNVTFNSSIQRIMVSGNDLFVGGGFYDYNSDPHATGVVVIDKVTGAVTGTNLNPDGSAYAFAESGGNVFVAGDFNYLKGVSGEYRNGLVALDTTTYEIASWDPGLSARGDSYKFQCHQGTLYAFEINTPNLFALNMDDASPTGWAPSVDNDVKAMAFGPDGVYLHGSFETLNSDSRHLLGAVTYDDGSTLPWDAITGGSTFEALSMSVSKEALYLAGNITDINGEGRSNLTAFSTVTGELLPWNPSVFNEGIAPDRISITTNKKFAFIYGKFDEVNGQAIYNVARLNLSDGVEDDLNTELIYNDYIGGLLVRGTSIFVSGSMFDSQYAAIELNKTSGGISSWDASISGVEGVSATGIAATGSTLFLSGDFFGSLAIYPIPPPQPNHLPVIAATTQTVNIDGLVSVYLPDILSDDDDGLDLTTLELVAGPSSGAPAYIDGDSNLIVEYADIKFAGMETITLKVCDFEEECTTQEVTLEVTGDVIVYNAVSPNGDGLNDIFLLQYIDILPNAVNNTVTIFDRWGNTVFNVENYDNVTRVFSGYNNSGDKLPSGTYYYKLEFSDDSRTGFISIR